MNELQEDLLAMRKKLGQIQLVCMEMQEKLMQISVQMMRMDDEAEAEEDGPQYLDGSQ